MLMWMPWRLHFKSCCLESSSGKRVLLVAGRKVFSPFSSSLPPQLLLKTKRSRMNKEKDGDVTSGGKMFPLLISDCWGSKNGMKRNDHIYYLLVWDSCWILIHIWKAGKVFFYPVFSECCLETADFGGFKTSVMESEKYSATMDMDYFSFYTHIFLKSF